MQIAEAGQQMESLKHHRDLPWAQKHPLEAGTTERQPGPPTNPQGTQALIS